MFTLILMFCSTTVVPVSTVSVVVSYNPVSPEVSWYYVVVVDDELDEVVLLCGLTLWSSITASLNASS